MLIIPLTLTTHQNSAIICWMDRECHCWLCSMHCVYVLDQPDLLVSSEAIIVDGLIYLQTLSKARDSAHKFFQHVHLR